MLTADPASDPNNYLVVALFVSRFNCISAFNKAGEDYWIPIMTPEHSLTDMNRLHESIFLCANPILDYARV